MPPPLALFLTLGFIGYLFWQDIRERPNITGALWLPVLWVFIVCSKTVSQWLKVLGIPGFVSTAMDEGSSLDALVLAGMIVSGIYILYKRQIRFSDIFKENRWLFLLVFYCLISAAWSDSPFISVKRWIKILGHPIMVLVVFTEPAPKEALTRLMKRCAYVVFPLSVVWMKYFPALGRSHGPSGIMQNSGITAGKNELGVVSIIFGLFLFWHLIQIWKAPKTGYRRKGLRLSLGLLLLAGYCLQKAHSATSVLSLLLAGMIMLGLALRFVDKRRVQAYAITAVVVLLIAQGIFDVFGAIVEMTGHESTLEGRGHLWQVLIATDSHPLLGAGYESFWSGKRLEQVWSLPEFWWHPIQAHNGYVEIYLNLGLIGLVILIGVIFVTFGKCRRDLLYDFEWGRLNMSYLLMIIAHNWTEAGFKGLSLMFFAFFITAISLPRRSFSTGASEVFSAEIDRGLAYSGRA